MLQSLYFIAGLSIGLSFVIVLALYIILLVHKCHKESVPTAERMHKENIAEFKRRNDLLEKQNALLESLVTAIQRALIPIR